MATASLPTEPPWLITGAAGLLGSEIVRQAAGRWPLYGVIFQRQPQPRPGVSYLRLDVGDPAAVLRLLRALRPQVIIHTAYRKAGPELERVTAAGAGHVAQAATQIGARLIHVSSDVLLDGEHAPYDESAQPASLHPYGRAKAEAERLVQEARAGRSHRAHLPDLPVGSARPDQRLDHRQPAPQPAHHPLHRRDSLAGVGAGSGRGADRAGPDLLRRRAERGRPAAAEPLRDGLAAGPAAGPRSPSHQRRPQPGQRAEPARATARWMCGGPSACCAPSCAATTKDWR
jgi:hypothetical protein